MLVCTLPSPACMCSATNTRLRSTSRWIALQRASTGANARPAKISSSGAFSSVFHDTTHRVVLQRRRTSSSRRSSEVLPARAHRRDERARLVDLARRGAPAAGRASPSGPHSVREQRARRRTPRARRRARSLLRDRELDVDALDAVGVVAEARERDDDVLVDLERVGVLGDRRGARAVEPELLARLGRHGDEALGAARVGDAHHLARPPSPTASSSSPTMSPSSTIFGRPWRLALVA